MLPHYDIVGNKLVNDLIYFTNNNVVTLIKKDNKKI